MGRTKIMIPLALTLLTVIIGVISAVTLKFMSQDLAFSIFDLILMYGLVLGLNATRLLLWGLLHKKYPLSFVFPLSAIFFPVILIVDISTYGEQITLSKLLGVILILLGVLILTNEESSSDQRHEI